VLNEDYFKRIYFWSKSNSISIWGSRCLHKFSLSNNWMTSLGTTTCDATFVPSDNSHGFKLLGLCRATGMRIVNGRFSNTHHFTFLSTSGFSVIDYLGSLFCKLLIHVVLLFMTTLVTLYSFTLIHDVIFCFWRQLLLWRRTTRR